MDNETDAEKPLLTVDVTLIGALLACCTVTLAGATRVKSGPDVNTTSTQ
jgi:hypothetical protein